MAASKLIRGQEFQAEHSRQSWATEREGPFPALAPGGSERLEFRPYARAVAIQDRDASLQAKTGPTGVTGIEIEGAAHHLGKRLVRVAENDHVGIFANDAAVERRSGRADIHDMMDEKFAAIELDDLGFLEGESGVGVAQHRGDGRDAFQLQDQPRQADIAGVENVVHAVEERRDFRVQVVVGVGKNANFHLRQGSLARRRHQSMFRAADSWPPAQPALASSGFASPAGSLAASAPSGAAFSRADSAASPSFMTPANRPVNSPPPRTVLRKNSQVGG